MHFAFRDKRGRLSVEYAALFAIIVGAIIVISPYLRRSFQGRYRSLGDELGTQYEPGATTIDATTVTESSTQEYEIPDATGNDTITVSSTNTTVTDDRHEEVTGY